MSTQVPKPDPAELERRADHALPERDEVGDDADLDAGGQMAIEEVTELLRCERLDALIELGYVRRNPGYGHPLRPEYVITAAGRGSAEVARRASEATTRETLLRKWSVPVLAELDDGRRFSESRAALPGVTPRALALALRALEGARLVRREVLPTRPPSTVYRATRRGAAVLGRKDDRGVRAGA